MTELPLELSVQEVIRLKEQDADFVLIDCREKDEQRLVSIAGAIPLPMSELPARTDPLNGLESRHLIVYCHHGIRSAQVTTWLRQQGFSRTQAMAGGIDAWAVHGDHSLPRY